MGTAIVRVSTCSPRCLTCEYMNPEVCITCTDQTNREAAP